MNMQNLMAQAQRVQKELQKANEEIEGTIFTGKSGAVTVEVSGKNEFKKLEITDESILSEKELLQDMIIVALNNAFEQINKMKQDKLGKYTGGLGGLF